MATPMPAPCPPRSPLWTSTACSRCSAAAPTARPSPAAATCSPGAAAPTPAWAMATATTATCPRWWWPWPSTWWWTWPWAAAMPIRWPSPPRAWYTPGAMATTASWATATATAACSRSWSSPCRGCSASLRAPSSRWPSAARGSSSPGARPPVWATSWSSAASRAAVCRAW